MNLKHLLTKALLVVAMLGGGTTVLWAQVSTWTATSGTYTKGQQITGSTAGVITMTLGEDDNWAYNSSRSAIYANTQQTPTTTNGIPTVGGYVVITPTRTLSLSMTTYSSQSNCNLYMYDSNGTKLKDFRQKGYCTNDFGTLEAGKTYYIYGGSFKSAGDLEYVFFQKFTATTYENYTIHYKDNNGITIKEDIIYSGLYGAEVTASAEDMASIEYGGNTYGYKSGNETITLGTTTNEITLVYETASVCNYKIKYVNDSDPAVEIKDEVEIESYVGAEVTASGDNLPTYITYNDVKYKYYAGNTTLTVTGNSATDVITLVYTPAAVYTYTLNATDGNSVLKQLATGTFVEGDDNPTVYFPKAFTQSGTLYETSETTFKKTFTGNETVNIVYTESSCDYIYDETELNVSHSYAGSYQKDYMSNGYGARIFKGSYVYTPALAGGIYTLVINAATYSGNPTLTYGIREGSTNTELGPTSTWANGSYAAQQTIKNIVIPDGASLCFINTDASNNSNVILDYVKLTKTADATVTKTITSAGWATYCSPYALDFSSAITNLDAAYIVTGGANGVLNKTAVTGTVPANTGLLLKGEGDCVIPVVASSTTDVSDNILTGVTSSTVIEAGTGWVLMASPSLGFYKNTNAFTVGANTAYIPTSKLSDPTTARKYFSLFADETTGIANVSENVDDDTFVDLSGRRVAQPTKGLYIVNGKKVLVK